ncbi:1-phosphofructokinase family hexose kinase [Spiroplasma floricola]|uniref:1-phosphofructokinase n=1 Tax=Spiroplasma floricola 23-6 TaxID=1336749 RepID=A0A2K8SE34_9MOLU|nr:1-phosphofructokinase family hexose kinase [Spiroplasma floricola]AUB31724.1 1-phosphofructokinase [Spiroplasma floricola 23-6]
MKNKIYIISLSPAIDYILEFDDLKKDKTNRPFNTEMYPSGKGIHIAMMLKNLSLESKSIIFTTGDLENYFYSQLDKLKIDYKKFRAKENIRINLKLIDSDQTECTAQAPAIDENDLKKMIEYLKQNLKEGDFVIATGSLPKGLDSKIYSQIVEVSNSLKCKCIVDAFGEPLNYAIEKKPFLIKPNIEELSLTTGIVINNEKDILVAGKKLLEKGVENILISMGKKGAIFLNKELMKYCSVGKWDHKLVNAAGAGDSMVAGFLNEYILTNDYEKALKMAIICGSATAYSKRIASKELVDQLKEQINSLELKNLE